MNVAILSVTNLYKCVCGDGLAMRAPASPSLEFELSMCGYSLHKDIRQEIYNVFLS